MAYFKSKGGNMFYNKSIAIDMSEKDIYTMKKKYDKDFHVEITKEEFINAYELVVKNLNEKVYGSK